MATSIRLIGQSKKELEDAIATLAALATFGPIRHGRKGDYLAYGLLIGQPASPQQPSQPTAQSTIDSPRTPQPD